MGGGGRLPPGAVADRAQRASEVARATFSDEQGPSVPCATCPPPATAEMELDGALIGRGCRPLTSPRAKGRLKPRQEVVGFADTGMGGQVPVFGNRPEDVGVQRQDLTADEVKSAFKRDHMVQSTSECCKAVRARSGRRTIVYTNGILTDLKTHCATLRKIAAATCADVIGVYNATEGPVSDLLQVRKDRALIGEAAAGKPVPVGDRRNPAVDSLHDLMVLSAQDPTTVEGQQPEYWAHSQGGAITSLALYDARVSLRAQGIQAPFANTRVTSFNAAAPQWVDGPQYTHFVHQGDFVAMRTGVGAAHGDSTVVGEGATVVEFSDLSLRGVIQRGLDPGSSGELAYQWREYHNTVPTGHGFGKPATGPSAWDPADSAHHSIDGPCLAVYRQRQVATGAPTCPEVGSGRSADSAHTGATP